MEAFVIIFAWHLIGILSGCFINWAEDADIKVSHLFIYGGLGLIVLFAAIAIGLIKFFDNLNTAGISSFFKKIWNTTVIKNRNGRWN